MNNNKSLTLNIFLHYCIGLGTDNKHLLKCNMEAVPIVVNCSFRHLSSKFLTLIGHMNKERTKLIRGPRNCKSKTVLTVTTVLAAVNEYFNNNINNDNNKGRSEGLTLKGH